jgi:hypothetical protein
VSGCYFRFSINEPLRGGLRAPLLEQLLARADGFTAVSDWRADAFRVIAPQAAHAPAVAAAALVSDLGPLPGAWVWIAAPVHYVAEMTSVRLAQDGILSLRPPEAVALAEDFNRVWSGSGVALAAGRSGALYCTVDRIQNVHTRDPQQVLGRHIEQYLPAGTDAPRLRQLMSEIEMWLFEHSVNSARTAQGLAPVSGLWLWGGGVPLTLLPAVQGFCAGEDVFCKAFAGAHDAESPNGVIALSQVPGTDSWLQAESHWLAAALKRLRSGAIERLDLSGGDRCFHVSSRGSRRFWRRRRPWWESFT